MSDDATRYRVPAARHRVEQLIDRSRFVCTIERVVDAGEAQAFLRALNAEFSDATHNCWAYVIGPPGSTSRIGMSDAGEPHGTAGRPMLTVLLNSGVGDIAAIVTRYYGGIKLGTGGLVKAYSGSVQLGLASLALVERVDALDVTVSVGYPAISAVQQLLPGCEAELLEQEFAADARFRLRIPRTRLADLRSALADATRGQATVRIDGETP